MANQKIRVMIVDNHQIFIEGIQSLLGNEEDIDVVAQANNGKDAILIIEKVPIDVILMDIEMPILNGYDAAAIITTRYPNIQVISLTSHDEKSIIQKMIDAGAKGYLLKNIDKKTLIDAIHAVYEGNRYYSSEIQIVLETINAKDIFHSDKQAISHTNLSSREIEVLRYIANGFSNVEVAEKLTISPKTVDTHRSNIMQKLEIHNVVGLVKYAIKLGLVG